jgi:lantibiotic modifying enzyme
MPTSATDTEAPAWTPILEGADAAAAWQAIDAVAAELTALPDERLQDPSLAGGAAGIALFFAYLAGVQEGRGHEDVAARLLDLAHTRVSEWPLPRPGLYSGFPGVAWVTEHVSGEPQLEADDVLESMLATPAHPAEEYDLISGAAGHAVYALAAGARPSADRLLERAVARIDDLSRLEHGGVRFWTPPERIWSDTRKLQPSGRFDCGLAHGVPGPIAALALALASGRLGDGAAATARTLLADALAVLQRHALPAGAAGRYPATWSPEHAPVASRLAWCYGDLGAAAALRLAAIALADPTLAAEADALTAASVARPYADSGVFDSGLCHGAAGNAIVFAVLAHTGGPHAARAREAARHWWRDAIARRKPGTGVGGYQAWFVDKHVDEVGWLTGAAGVALSLLAAVTDVFPAWAGPLLIVEPKPSFGDGV